MIVRTMKVESAQLIFILIVTAVEIAPVNILEIVMIR